MSMRGISDKPKYYSTTYTTSYNANESMYDCNIELYVASNKHRNLSYHWCQISLIPRQYISNKASYLRTLLHLILLPSDVRRGKNSKYYAEWSVWLLCENIKLSISYYWFRFKFSLQCYRFSVGDWGNKFNQ